MRENLLSFLCILHLQEADYLADRIMILKGGQVKALGDSLFLKKTYGTGYEVRMTVEPDKSPLVIDVLRKVR